MNLPQNLRGNHSVLQESVASHDDHNCFKVSAYGALFAHEDSCWTMCWTLPNDLMRILGSVCVNIPWPWPWPWPWYFAWSGPGWHASATHVRARSPGAAVRFCDVMALFVLYAWWVYFPQSGALAVGTSRPVSHKHDRRTMRLGATVAQWWLHIATVPQCALMRRRDSLNPSTSLELWPWPWPCVWPCPLLAPVGRRRAQSPSTRSTVSLWQSPLLVSTWFAVHRVRQHHCDSCDLETFVTFSKLVLWLRLWLSQRPCPWLALQLAQYLTCMRFSNLRIYDQTIHDFMAVFFQPTAQLNQIRNPKQAKKMCPFTTVCQTRATMHAHAMYMCVCWYVCIYDDGDFDTSILLRTAC